MYWSAQMKVHCIDLHGAVRTLWFKLQENWGNRWPLEREQCSRVIQKVLEKVGGKKCYKNMTLRVQMGSLYWRRNYRSGISPLQSPPRKEDKTYFGMEMKEKITVKKNGRHSSLRGALGQGPRDRVRQFNPSPISCGSPLILVQRYRPVLHVPQPSLFLSLISWHSPQYLPRCNTAINYRCRAADGQREGRMESKRGWGTAGSGHAVRLSFYWIRGVDRWIRSAVQIVPPTAETCALGEDAKSTKPKPFFTNGIQTRQRLDSHYVVQAAQTASVIWTYRHEKSTFKWILCDQIQACSYV